MEIVELIIDEEMENAGIDCISLVSEPAIMESWVALSKQHEIKFAQVDPEQRIILGAALVPGRMIYRKSGDREYYVHFSESTVKKSSELFFKNGNHQNSTLEHQSPISGMTVVESWLITDPEMDKSKLYGMKLPKGTWMISMKVDDDDIWENEILNKKTTGFSIEGFYVSKAEKNHKENHSLDQEIKAEKELSKIREIIQNSKSL